MRVLIRVEASPTVGLGHLVRCGALATALAARGHEAIVRTATSADLVARFAPDATTVPVANPPSPDLRTPDLGTPEGRTVDATATAALAARSAADWVVVDHYDLGDEWEALVGAPTGASVLAIDDLHRAHRCDLLLDQNLGARPRPATVVPPAADQLLGPDFALLRPQFAAPAHEAQRPAHVLVEFGGTSRPTWLDAVLGALVDRVGADAELTVLVGSAAAAGPVLRTLEAEGRVDLRIGERHVAPLLDRATLVLGATGSTSWERCARGRAAVTVTLADNQQPLADALAAEGAIRHLGAADAVDPSALAAAVADLLDHPARRAMQGAARRVCDGRGAERVVDAMEAATIGLREASSADADVLRAWRNDPVTRSASFDTAEVDPATHVAWLAGVLGDPDRRLWIGERGGVPVGTVRVDGGTGHDDPATISVAVAPAQRGTGVAPRLIGRAARAWFDAGRGAIDAWIRTDNVASRRAFARAGFAEVPEDSAHAAGESAAPDRVRYRIAPVPGAPPGTVPSPDPEGAP